MAQQDIAVLDGTTFMVSDAAGDVLPGSGHGFFHADTRFLSGFTVLLNGHRLHPLSSGNLDQRSATFYTTNETTPGLAPHTLTLIRERSLNGGLHERLVLVNYGQQVADVTLTVDLAADFADIFQARSGSVRKAGTIEVEGGPEAVRFTYRRRHFVRQAVVYFDPLPHVSGSRATYALQLAPQESRTLDVHVLPVLGDTCPPQPWGASLERPDATSPPNASGIRSMEGSCPDLSTSDLGLALAYRRAVSDLVALRLRINDEQELPAAGLPWYMAIFGRDSIITALETLLLGPGLAVGTLRTLAAYQGRQVDPFRDEEPGKIPHEIREGELSSLEELPHTRYYGTVDATPLWLVLLSETYRWTGDLELVRELLPAAEAALAWIDHYGDLDGDGFVEYLGRSPRGLTHQGWKDSADPVRFADGTLAEPPIALCEVQGYVYDAKLRMAELYEALGHRRRARELRQAAAALRRRFHEAFWLPDHQYIALALDGHKRPVDAIASNAGHCLWSGILEPEAAAAVARRLLSPELFSGWGIRTLSSAMRAYNPISYHNGSVWPHDTAIAAAGLARYGFRQEARRVVQALVDASAHFPQGRLPELFAGYPRHPLGFPVAYPDANAPQAWACGAIVLALQTLLGLNPRGDYLAADLLPDLPDLALYGVPFRGDAVSILVHHGSIQLTATRSRTRGAPRPLGNGGAPLRRLDR